MTPEPYPPPVATGPEHLEFWEKRLRGDDRRFVYVIQAGGSGSPIKVGKAINPRRRIATFQTANANTLRLLYVIPGYELMERALHARLAEYRISGEWFFGDGIHDFLNWMRDYCEAEKDYYWQTGNLARPPEIVESVAERSGPQPQPRMAPRSLRRNRATRLRSRQL